MDEAFLRAIIHAESAFNPRAMSLKGAQGLMQLMPGTALDMGVRDAFDTAQNIRGGARYLGAAAAHVQRQRAARRRRPTTPAPRPCSATTACRRMPKRRSTWSVSARCANATAWPSGRRRDVRRSLPASRACSKSPCDHEHPLPASPCEQGEGPNACLHPLPPLLAGEGWGGLSLRGDMEQALSHPVRRWASAAVAAPG